MNSPILLDEETGVGNGIDPPGSSTRHLIGRYGMIVSTIVGTQDWIRHEAFGLIEYPLNEIIDRPSRINVPFCIEN